MNAKIWFFTVVVAALAGSLATFVAIRNIGVPDRMADDRIKEFYLTENAVHVSPHSLRGKMAKGDGGFVLVDLRSQEEYEKEHIIGAVSIPAYSDKYTSAYGDVERIVGAFQDLMKKNSGKDIIVYCYSTPCMTGRKVGGMLAEHDIYVKHLGIGWNEWRYDWAGWNHEHEWETIKVEDYIVTGSDPGGTVTSSTPPACDVGGFGC